MQEALHNVATHLISQARSMGSEMLVDAYARSAFNRYYYSSFLSTRELLSQLNGSWGREPHKNIPKILSENVVGQIKKTA